MPLQILLMVFKFSIPAAAYRETAKRLVEETVSAPGLRWKIWLINEPQSTAGGIYLFDEPSYVDMFLASPLMDRLKHHPAVTNVFVMPFNILDAETRSTHGPLGSGARV